MSTFYIVAAVLAALAAGLLTRPWWWNATATGDVSTGDEVQRLSMQLRQLGELHRAGALSAEQYAESKSGVERRLLARLVDPASADAKARLSPSRRLVSGLVLFMLIIAVGGYAWIGSPGSLGLGPGSGSGVTSIAASADDGGAAEGASAPHGLVPEQVAAMVDQLVQRLKDKPDDGDGWLMLARSQVVLGRHAQAVESFKQAMRLRPDDASLLADYADALAVANGRRLDGAPATLVARALELDPANPKALALAGTAAFDRHDYAGAVRHWEKLVEVEPGDDGFVQQIRASIAEARQLAGLPPAATTLAASGSAAAGASISGTVSLAPALEGRASSDDTLFVFARAVSGSRMPLAILRKRVGDLPLQFTLDDQMAMSDAARLSGVKSVMVGARISKSGNAMPQVGDLQGMIGAVSVGATGLKVEINQEVTK